MAEKGHQRICLADRLALRPKEAAEAMGISERKLRELLPQLPHVRLDGVVVLPTRLLERWLETRSQADASRAERLASEILDTE